MANLKRKNVWILAMTLLTSIMSCSESNEHEISEDKPDNPKMENFEFGNNYGGELTPINSSEYSRYLLAENTSEDYIISSIKEYGELSGGKDFQEYEFGIFKKNNWILIKVPNNLGFYQFHNLIAWLWGYGQEAKLPTMTYGVAICKNDSTKNYFAELDQNTSDGDVVVGAFQNGNSHYVFLPMAFEDSGNMKISNEINYDFNLISQKFSEIGLSFNTFNSQSYENIAVKFFE